MILKAAISIHCENSEYFFLHIQKHLFLLGCNEWQVRLYTLSQTMAAECDQCGYTIYKVGDNFLF
jgi:hypothetical protein